MKTDRKKELQVGIITLAALIVLVTALLLGNRISFLSESYDIVIELENAGGLKKGEPVMLRGVNLGKVKDIEVTACCVRAYAEIDDISLLTYDTRAAVSMLELTGGRKIDLLPGVSNEPFDVNKPIIALPPSDLASLMSNLSDLESDFKDFFEKVDVLVTNLNSLTGDSVFIAEVKATLGETKNAISDLNNVINTNSDNINEIVSDMKASGKSLRRITEGNETNLIALTDNITKITEETERFLRESGDLPEDIKVTIKELREFSESLNAEGSALHLLLEDPEFSATLKTTVTKLDTLVEQINEHGVNINVRLGKRPKK